MNSIPHVTLTYDDTCHILQSLLAKDQVSVGEAVLMRALALREAIPQSDGYKAWLNLALWAAELECRAGRSAVLASLVERAGLCRLDDGLGLLQFLGESSTMSGLAVVRRNVLLAKLAPFAVKWLNAREAAAAEQARSAVVPPASLLSWIPSVQAASTLAKDRAAAEAASACRRETGRHLERSGISRFLESPNAASAWQAAAGEIARAEKAWAGEILFANASCAKASKDFVRALTEFQEAMERYTEAGDLVAVSSCFREMGWCTCPDDNPQGGWEQASDLFRKAAATAETAGPDQINIAVGLYGQGWCAEPANNPRGDWEVSISFYKRAADAGERAKNDWWESKSLHAVGFCYEPVHAPFGDWKTASEWYRRAAAIRSVARLELPLANTYYRLAMCLSSGDRTRITAEAGELFKQARALYQVKGDAEGVAKVDSWLESTKEPPARLT